MSFHDMIIPVEVAFIYKINVHVQYLLIFMLMNGLEDDDAWPWLENNLHGVGELQAGRIGQFVVIIHYFVMNSLFD